MKHFNKIGFKNIENAVFIDIETAAEEPKLTVDTPLYESWKYKQRNEEDLSYEALNKSYLDKAPLYSFSARVVTIVLGYVNNGKIKTKAYSHNDEKELLLNFFVDVEKFASLGKKFIVGYSTIGFDIPFIYFRALKHDLSIPTTFDVGCQKEWNLEYHIDLNSMLRGTAFNNMGLVNVCIAFGLPSPKVSLQGDGVSDLFWSKDKKKIQKIEAYCTEDVIAVIRIMTKILQIKIEI